ncbi:hypothetical protein CPB84DRAFT_876825 [Gymnopilus junonius]|uniref:Uncharacterized protein n=1 Tax=Gymnopilus junonius TaxID=109634 RepID=A0A9P5NPN0_GYMJU|nr:hypothetical protein CPB84DRAFT_876825 [Gymnopilus junonius]
MFNSPAHSPIHFQALTSFSYLSRFQVRIRKTSDSYRCVYLASISLGDDSWKPSQPDRCCAPLANAVAFPIRFLRMRSPVTKKNEGFLSLIVPMNTSASHRIRIEDARTRLESKKHQWEDEILLARWNNHPPSPSHCSTCLELPTRAEYPLL